MSMALFDIEKLLKENTYPGRGIVIGQSADGKSALIAYFIMGRSENSRNRIFERFEGGRAQSLARGHYYRVVAHLAHSKAIVAFLVLDGESGLADIIKIERIKK